MAEQLRVFVSHASEDRAFCDALVRALIGAGADVWYDERNLGSGVLRREIMRELSARPVFLVVLSKAAFVSSWVQDECEWAYNLYRRKPERLMLPVVGAPYDPGDFDTLLYIESMKRIEASGNQPYPTDAAIHHLLRALALTPAGEAPVSTAPQPTESVDDLLTRGKALAAQEQFAEALPLFQRAIQLAPGSFDAWADLGWVLGQLRRHNEQLTACDRALALDDKQALVWSNKGGALVGLGNYREALAACDRAITLDPNDPVAWNNKGASLNGLGRHKEALVAIDRALGLSETASRWINKGGALLGLGRYVEALAAYDRALALDPTDDMAWNNKGYALHGLQRDGEAMAAVDRSLALNPDLGEGWSTKGEILYGMRRYEDALICLDRAIRLIPNHPEIWHDRAVALRGLGRDAEAKAAEKRARELGWRG